VRCSRAADRALRSSAAPAPGPRRRARQSLAPPPQYGRPPGHSHFTESVAQSGPEVKGCGPWPAR